MGIAPKISNHVVGLAMIDVVVMFAFCQISSAIKPHRRVYYKGQCAALGLFMRCATICVGKDSPPFKPWPWERTQNAQVVP